MASTNRITTRSKNAAQHPGLAISKQQRRTSQQVAAERQAKEVAKKQKELNKAAGINRIAEYEETQAAEDAVEATPRPAPKSKARGLVRTRSYADVTKAGKVDVGMDTDVGSVFEPEDIRGREVTESEGDAEAKTDTDTDASLSPPKKKKRVEVKHEDTAKAAKPPKPKVRDAIKAVQVNKAAGDLVPVQYITTAQHDFIDLDPTPKKTKAIGNEVEYRVVADQQKEPRWKMPTMVGGDVDVKSVGKSRERKAKGKGKAKVSSDHDSDGDSVDPETRSDRKLPKSKSDSTSGKKGFSSGINDWAAAIPIDAKPTSKATATTGSNRSVPPLTNTSTRSSASSVLSKNITVSQIIPKTEPTNDSIEIVNGGLSDADETVGFEREAAVASPPKGKRRATSSGIVKETPRVKRIKKLSNNDLPDGVEPKVWRRHFITTYMQYVASLDNPWDVPIKVACEIMQLIWDALFSHIPHTVDSNSSVYRITVQRIADSYRSAIGSAAISILTAYFESQDELKDSDENRQEFAKYALDNLRFLYRRGDGDDKTKFRGLYQGTFVVQTFAAHFSAIEGARKISGINDPDSANANPYGGLALASSAFERVLTLVSTGTLTIKMIRDAKGRTVTLPKTLNHSTGKQSNRQTGFNDVTWGNSTRSYAKSIKRALTNDKFSEITTRAKEFCKKSRRVDDGPDNALDGDTINEELDERAQLMDISSSESD